MTFTDDGYSGTNFDRPGISKLLELTKAKEIDCIIVKDFSRFGRNYLEVGNFIEQIFPLLGVRFISVNDNFDSNLNNGAAGAIDVAFKNLIYDLYSKDISQKIQSVRRAKAEAGKFVTAFAPYGYVKLKSDKNTLIIDEECAIIVRRIYQMAFDGTAKGAIARQLNAEKIPSPIMVRKQRKDNFKNWCANEKCHWTAATVARILDDRRYTGDLVYGKVKPSAVGSRKDIRVPEDEWIITPNAYPAIIMKEVFNAIGSMKKTHSYKRGISSPLSGKIKCAVCNHTFIKNSKYNEYRCRTYLHTDEYSCFSGKLTAVSVEAAILVLLNTFVSLCEKSENDKDEKANGSETLRINIISLERKVVIYKKERLNNYESYKAKKILKEIFLTKQVELENNIKFTEEELKQLKSQYHRILTLSNESTLCALKGYAPFEVLTKDISDNFIEKIVVDEKGKLQVHWTFSIPFDQPTI